MSVSAGIAPVFGQASGIAQHGYQAANVAQVSRSKNPGCTGQPG